MRTPVEEFEKWIQTPRENQNLEFKRAENQYDTNKLLRYCVALANEGGGKFILGVTDKPPRQVPGSLAFPNIDKIAGHIFEKLRFRVDVEELYYQDSRVLIFHIPSRPRGTAYSLDGAYLMRSTEETVPMSEDRLRTIFNEGQPDWLSQTAAQNCTDADVIHLLDTQSYFDLLKVPW